MLDRKGQKIMNKLLLIASLMLLAVPLTLAQSNEKPSDRTEAENLVRQVIALFRDRKFNEALPLAEKAVALSESSTGTTSDLTAAALFNLANIQLAKRKTKEAEVTYDRYLAVYEKVVGESARKFIDSLDGYVCTMIDFDRRSKALEIQKRIYRLDNKFDFAETSRALTKNMEKAGLSAGYGENLPPPTYSPAAKSLGISGSALFKVVVDETGRVTTIKPLCGHRLLLDGAEPAILKSKFKPTIVGGKPVKVTFIAIYNFVL